MNNFQILTVEELLVKFRIHALISTLLSVVVLANIFLSNNFYILYSSIFTILIITIVLIFQLGLIIKTGSEVEKGFSALKPIYLIYILMTLTSIIVLTTNISTLNIQEVLKLYKSILSIFNPLYLNEQVSILLTLVNSYDNLLLFIIIPYVIHNILLSISYIRFSIVVKNKLFQLLSVFSILNLITTLSPILTIISTLILFSKQHRLYVNQCSYYLIDEKFGIRYRINGSRRFGRKDFKQYGELVKYISRNHFIIITKDGEIYVKDLGSLNGTFVNGIDIRGKDYVKLNPGDKLNIAKVIELKLIHECT